MWLQIQTLSEGVPKLDRMDLLTHISFLFFSFFFKRRTCVNIFFIITFVQFYSKGEGVFCFVLFCFFFKAKLVPLNLECFYRPRI